jgi:hypothetical protein
MEELGLDMNIILKRILEEPYLKIHTQIDRDMVLGAACCGQRQCIFRLLKSREEAIYETWAEMEG